jgi:tetratricopeptide (TPR) repeat protein
VATRKCRHTYGIVKSPSPCIIPFVFIIKVIIKMTFENVGLGNVQMHLQAEIASIEQKWPSNRQKARRSAAFEAQKAKLKENLSRKGGQGMEEEGEEEGEGEEEEDACSSFKNTLKGEGGVKESETCGEETRKLGGKGGGEGLGGDKGKGGGLGAGGEVGKEEGKAWLEAARKGNMDELKKLLANSPHLLSYQGAGTKYGAVGHSAMHWCAARGHVECLRLLLESKANVNCRNKGAATPLHAAAQQDQVDCARLLLRHGADLAATDLGGANPQDSARKLGMSALEAAGVFDGGGLGGGGGDEGEDEGDDEVDFLAALEREKKLRARGETAEELKSAGNKLFADKAFEGAVAKYSAALELEPDNHTVLSNRSAALLSLGRMEAALKDAGACVRAAPEWSKGYSRKGAAYLGMGNCYDATVAFRAGLALDPGNAVMLEGLKEAERRLKDIANQWDELPDSEDEATTTTTSSLPRPLPAATTPATTTTLPEAPPRAREKGGNERVRGERAPLPKPSPAVSEEGGSVKWGEAGRGGSGGPATCEGGFTFPKEIDFEDKSTNRDVGRKFMDAAKNGQTEELEQLLLASPHLLWYRGQGTSYGFLGNSALHYAAAKGHTDMLRMLILAKSDVNAQNRGGSSVLHSAAANNNAACCKMLLQCGARKTVGDQDGERPEESARRRGHAAAVDAIADFRPQVGVTIEDVCMPEHTRSRAKIRAFLDKLDAAKLSWSPLPATPPAPTASAAPATGRKEGEEEKGVQNGEKKRETVGGVKAEGKAAGGGRDGGKGGGAGERKSAVGKGEGGGADEDGKGKGEDSSSDEEVCM